jgi:hypothetical protein
MSFETYFDTRVYVYINNNRNYIARSMIMYATNSGGSTNHPMRLGSALSVTVTLTGKTMKLINLPIYPALPSESSTVYREADGQGNYYVKVKG